MFVSHAFQTSGKGGKYLFIFVIYSKHFSKQTVKQKQNVYLKVSCICIKSKMAATRILKTIQHLANSFDFSQNSALIKSKNCEYST